MTGSTSAEETAEGQAALVEVQDLLGPDAGPEFKVRSSAVTKSRRLRAMEDSLLDTDEHARRDAVSTSETSGRVLRDKFKELGEQLEAAPRSLPESRQIIDDSVQAFADGYEEWFAVIARRAIEEALAEHIKRRINDGRNVATSKPTDRCDCFSKRNTFEVADAIDATADSVKDSESVSFRPRKASTASLRSTMSTLEAPTATARDSIRVEGSDIELPIATATDSRAVDASAAEMPVVTESRSAPISVNENS